MNSSTQTITIQTDPPSAIVKVGSFVKKTPCKIKLDRKYKYLITINKNGYVPVTTFLINNRKGGWFFGNFILLPLFFIGMGIDYLTGAIYSFDKTKIKIKLKPVKKI
jgi:PEGA domain